MQQTFLQFTKGPQTQVETPQEEHRRFQQQQQAFQEQLLQRCIK